MSVSVYKANQQNHTYI